MEQPLTYLDFDLTIEAGAGREYPVRLSSPAGEAQGTFHLPFDSLQLQNALLQLQNALLRSGGRRRKVPSPEQRAVRDFGGALFDALICDEIRTCFGMSLREAEREGKGLRLKLRIQPPELAALPWEYLYDRRADTYLVLSRHTPLVRYLELPRPARPLAVTPPLRVLAMIANPSDTTTLDVERERARIETALRQLVDEGWVELHWLSPPTWRDLQRALRRGGYHVFHFVGHGEFNRLQEEGQLILEDQEGRADRLSAGRLARLLADHRSLRLAVLNACESAYLEGGDPFASTAAALVRAGIPAVVAMQYEVTDDAAVEFSQVFYESLADNLPVDAALAEARKAISLAVTNTVEWGTPALYTHAPDGQIFDLPRRVREKAAARIAPEKAGPAEVGPVGAGLRPAQPPAQSPAQVPIEKAEKQRRLTLSERLRKMSTWVWGSVVAVVLGLFIFIGSTFVPGLLPTPTPPAPSVGIEAFLITKRESPTVMVKPGTTIIATVQEIVQIKVEASTTYAEQEQNLVFTWFTCRTGSSPVLQRVGNTEMLYVAPSEPGSDCIVVVVEKGGALLDRSEIFVDVQK